MRLGTIILTATLLTANSASAIAQRLTHFREVGYDFIVETELTYDKAGRLVKKVQEAYEPKNLQVNYNPATGNISYSVDKGEYLGTSTYSITYENNKATIESTSVTTHKGGGAAIMTVATLENGRVVSSEVSAQGVTYFTDTYAYNADGQLATLTHTSNVEEPTGYAPYDSFVMNFTWSGGNIVSATAESRSKTSSISFNYTSHEVPANDRLADDPFRDLQYNYSTQGMEDLFYFENLLGARNKNLTESINIVTTYKDKSHFPQTENNYILHVYQYDGNTLLMMGQEGVYSSWIWDLTWNSSYTGIKPQTDALHAGEQYTLTGTRASQGGKGLRIVRQKDGSVRKVVVR